MVGEHISGNAKVLIWFTAMVFSEVASLEATLSLSVDKDHEILGTKAA